VQPTGHSRQEMVQICRLLYQRGLIVGTEGNVSVRMAPNRFWITPAGRHKGLLQPEDPVLIDAQGRVHFGSGRPSSETAMHLAVYQHRSDVQAVVHAHPPIATALTVAGYGLEPALLPEAVVALGEVPTVPYRMPTTHEFARDVGESMRHAEAALLENHGCITVGPSLMTAFNRMETVERVAQIFYLARTLGHVQRLAPADVEALRSLMHTSQHDTLLPHMSTGDRADE
jgi:L-fuculose-phosphate aldolase